MVNTLQMPVATLFDMSGMEDMDSPAQPKRMNIEHPASLCE
jgi:hypothetical protein